jgi:putative tryptophan/tyrosine transport system substrate-binding protein
MDRVLIDSLEVNLKSALRNLKFAILIGAVFFAPCFSALAQQPTKIARIGYLGGPSPLLERREAFRQGLRDLGYVEGKNIVIECCIERTK